MDGPSPDIGALRLRAATNADIPALRQLIFGILRDFGLSPDPGSTDADLDDLEAAYFARGGRFDVLTEPGGRIIASVGLYRIDDQTVELRKMYLAEEFRGRGLGRRLLDHALAQARQLGYRRMTLETASVLKQAISLYTCYGFVPYAPDHMSCRCDQAYVLEL